LFAAGVVIMPGSGQLQLRVATPVSQTTAAGVSLQGTQRRGNEDCFVVDPEQRFFVVADGVGGTRGGQVASSMACELLRPRLSAVASGARGRSAVEAELLQAFRHTHQMIVRRQQQEERLQEMATSLLAAVQCGHDLYLASVGDCRALLVRNGTVRQLTRDHTIANGLLAAGCLTEELAAIHPFRDVVYNVLGGQGCKGVADVSRIRLRPADRLVLTTDGVTDFLSAAQIVDVLNHAVSAAHAARRLTQAAIDAGSGDDVTAVVIDVQQVGDSPDGTGGREDIEQASVENQRGVSVLPWFPGGW
jgi:serine/threonine protein phosphatase PrpC